MGFDLGDFLRKLGYGFGIAIFTIIAWYLIQSGFIIPMFGVGGSVNMTAWPTLLGSTVTTILPIAFLLAMLIVLIMAFFKPREVNPYYEAMKQQLSAQKAIQRQQAKAAKNQKGY